MNPSTQLPIMLSRMPIWQMIIQYLPRLLLLSTLAAVVALLIVQKMAPVHYVHFSYLISLSERQQPAEYDFDGYYALQAIDSFAATLAQWVQTPEVVVAAYEAAGVPLTTTDPRSLANLIVGVKSAPQLVHVTVTHNDAGAAQKIAQGLQVVMMKNIAKYHDQGVPVIQVKVVSTEPWQGTKQVAREVIVIATFVFTFFISLNGILLLGSLQKASTSS